MKKQATIISDYYTVSEAARILKVNPSTIWRWIDARKLPAYRAGPKSIRIKKAHLEHMLRPARVAEERTEYLWSDYDPEKVRAALAETAGTWADLDTEALIEHVYRAREEGSRPADRP